MSVGLPEINGQTQIKSSSLKKKKSSSPLPSKHNWKCLELAKDTLGSEKGISQTQILLTALLTTHSGFLEATSRPC